MNFGISNFLNTSTLEIISATGLAELGPLVHVYCSSGSLSMQHSVTPAQAREMAAALLACAADQDATVNAEFAELRADLKDDNKEKA